MPTWYIVTLLLSSFAFLVVVAIDGYYTKQKKTQSKRVSRATLAIGLVAITGSVSALQWKSCNYDTISIKEPDDRQYRECRRAARDRNGDWRCTDWVSERAERP